MGPTCSAKICCAVYAIFAWKQLDTWATLQGRKSYVVRLRSTVNESSVEQTRSGFASSFQSTFTLRRSAFGHGSKGRGTMPINEDKRRKEKATYLTRLEGRKMAPTNDRKRDEGIIEIQGIK